MPELWANYLATAMKHYILFYEVTPDYLEKRQPLRDTHLRLLRQLADEGSLIMAGAYAEPANGAALIFKGDTADVAESFARMDPYVANGLVTKWWVREWTVAVGSSL